MIGNVGTVCAPNGPCLIPVAPGLMAPSGVLMIGIALVLRDLVQRRLGVGLFRRRRGRSAPSCRRWSRRRRWCWRRAWRFCFRSSPISRSIRRSRAARLVAAVVASSVVGLVVDSIVFLWLAFGSLEFLLGQVVGKGWMVLLSIPLVHVSAPPRRAARPRRRPDEDFMSAAFDVLRRVTTATITTMLLKKGIRHCWMKGAMPLVPGGKRLVGPAFTLRFVPVREDLATPESWGKPISTRAAIEAMPEGCIAVADAMGVTTAGIFGDILVMRMVRRGVTALVTDGVIRDKAGCLAAELPIFCQGTAAPASVNGLTFVGWNEPIACGGCAIFPGDVIVADDDGAVVIPQALVDFVANEGEEHELYESWVVSEVERGVALPGLYPPNDEAKARYAAWKTKRR